MRVVIPFDGADRLAYRLELAPSDEPGKIRLQLWSPTRNEYEVTTSAIELIQAVQLVVRSNQEG